MDEQGSQSSNVPENAPANTPSATEGTNSQASTPSVGVGRALRILPGLILVFVLWGFADYSR